MPDISKITLPSGNTYDIKDAVARQMISGGVSFTITWDGTSVPVVSDIPAGVVVTYNNVNYTGTLSADSAQAGAFYLVKSTTQTSGGISDIYDEYVPVGTSGAKTWEKIGDTQVDLSDVVMGITTTTNKVLGDNTTFTNASSSVSFSGGTNDRVLGESTTFSTTVTPSTTYLEASASGTANAITALGTPSTDTFVKSVSAETNKKLVTTTVANVTGNAAVTANKSNWSFTMGTGDASETLIIGGGNGSDVTATNTTLGTEKTVATGETSASGTGDAIVTGVTVGDSAAAITAFGTPTTASVVTGVNLSSNSTSATGRVQVATGITSANTTARTSGAGSDIVTVVTNIGTGTAAAQTITVNKDEVDAVITVTPVYGS